MTNVQTRGSWLVEQAHKKGLTLRLLGGCAVAMWCGRAWTAYPVLSRKPADVDLAGYAREEGLIRSFFRDVGARAAREFNALNSGRRLIYEVAGVKVDIFLDEFAMCHRWSFRDRLNREASTLPLADLLLTKLQIVHGDEKDERDIVSLLLAAGNAAGAGESQSGSFDADYVIRLCSRDWGLWRSVTKSLMHVGGILDGYALEFTDRERLLGAVRKLDSALEMCPKSFAWRLRSLLGERVKWYQIPEEPELIFELEEDAHDGVEPT